MNGPTTGHSEGLVGGVDGVPGRGRSSGATKRGGWVMAVTGVVPGSPLEDVSVWRSFADLWSHAQQRGLLAVTVDIPIGLPGSSGRSADGEARTLLKPGRTSSVFNAPPLCAIKAESYEDALKRSRDHTGHGLSKQAYALIPKTKDVREVLEGRGFLAGACPQAAEVHPEVSFRDMAGRPMSFHKSLQAGVAERLAALEPHFSNIVDSTVRTRICGPPHPDLMMCLMR